MGVSAHSLSQLLQHFQIWAGQTFTMAHPGSKACQVLEYDLSQCPNKRALVLSRVRLQVPSAKLLEPGLRSAFPSKNALHFPTHPKDPQSAVFQDALLR